MIEIRDLSRTYGSGSNKAHVLHGIDMNIERGAFTAVLGKNGCGKSTLVRHINAILKPQRGSVRVDGMDTKDPRRLYDIREKAGIVFQDPDSQSVAATVEDDTAFAPENLGLSEDEISERVEAALRAAGIAELRKKSISELSGGQKQLTAVAGIIAMRPDYMIFDESTSMLDPLARSRVLECVMRLKRELDVSVIWITHYMDEAAAADRVVIINDGKIAADGTPEEVFSDIELIERCGLELPPCAQLCVMLKNAGYDVPRLALNAHDCALLISGMTAAAVKEREGAS